MDFEFVMPAWAVSDDAQAWVSGFVLMGMVRIFRACLRWFRRTGTEGGGSD